MLEKYALFAVCVFYQSLFVVCEDVGMHHEVVHVSGWPHDGFHVDADNTQLITCISQSGKEKYTTERLLVDLKANICKKVQKAIITKQLIVAEVEHQQLEDNEVFVILVVNEKLEVLSESHFLVSIPLTMLDDEDNFHFNLSIVCEVNYYGEHCTKHCIPLDPHMKCNQSGHLVCIDPEVCNTLHQVDPCLSHPCSNGGICVTMRNGGYKCLCADRNCLNEPCGCEPKEAEHKEVHKEEHKENAELKMECTSEFCQCSNQMTAAENRVKCDLQDSSFHGYCSPATCMKGTSCSDEHVCHWQSPCQLLTKHELHDYLPPSCSHVELKITRAKLPREMTVTEFCQTIKSNYIKGTHKPLVLCDVVSSNTHTIIVDLFLYSEGGLTSKQMENLTFIQLLQSDKKLSGVLGAVVRAKLQIRGRNMESELVKANKEDGWSVLSITALVIVISCTVLTLSLAVYCRTKSKRERYNRFDSLQDVRFSKNPTPIPASTTGGNDDESIGRNENNAL